MGTPAVEKAVADSEAEVLAAGDADAEGAEVAVYTLI
jgi:hypothetical protein